MTMRRFPAAIFFIAATLAAQAPPDTASWKVTQVAGPPGIPGRKLTLTASGESLVLTDLKTGSVLTIPMSQITEVRYSVSDFERSQQVVGNKYGQSGIVEPSHEDYCLANDNGCHVASLVGSLIFGLATSGSGTSHYVTVTWEDRGVEQQTRVDVPKNDAFRVETELTHLFGTRWMDVSKDDYRLAQVVHLGLDKAVKIEIARDSWCGGYSLRAGNYRVWVLEGHSETLAYFVAEGAPIDRPAAVVKAEKRPETEGSQIEYTAGSGHIVSLAMQGTRLAFQ